MNTEKQLEIKNIHKIYDKGKKTEHLAIKDISFTINKGEFVCLLGPSGCGKTTLLSIVAGFENKTDGEILLNDKTVEKPGPDRGFVFQSYALFPWMTVMDNVTYPMRIQKIDKEKRVEKANELLNMAGLIEAKDKYPSNLSGGMKQRTAVVRALAGNPEILLLDEPLSAIDFQMRQSMQDELLELLKAAKTTVLMVTHDVDEAVYLADRIIVMCANGGYKLVDYKVDLPYPRLRKSKEYESEIEVISEYLMEASKGIY